jgi:hypothetical protein
MHWLLQLASEELDTKVQTIMRLCWFVRAP